MLSRDAICHRMFIFVIDCYDCLLAVFRGENVQVMIAGRCFETLTEIVSTQMVAVLNWDFKSGSWRSFSIICSLSCGAKVPDIKHTLVFCNYQSGCMHSNDGRVLVFQGCGLNTLKGVQSKLSKCLPSLTCRLLSRAFTCLHNTEVAGSGNECLVHYWLCNLDKQNLLLCVMNEIILPCKTRTQSNTNLQV